MCKCVCVCVYVCVIKHLVKRGGALQCAAAAINTANKWINAFSEFSILNAYVFN